MPVTSGISGGLSTLGDLIMNIRAKIPDVVDNPTDDGAFAYADLVRFINSALQEMTSRAPIIQDWSAVASEAGMDLYELSPLVYQVNQLWYDNYPCAQAPEGDALFVTKIQGRSYYFGPHSSGNPHILHVWPCADRTASVTTLSSGISPTDTIIPLTVSTGFRPYGFAKIDDEILAYRTIDGNSLKQILRGQAGTVALAHTTGTSVQELNIMMRVVRLAREVTDINSTIDVPASLWPVIDLSVLHDVRTAEQEFQEAARLEQDFSKSVMLLAETSTNKIRQAIQVRSEVPGPLLYRGRVYVP